MKRRKIERRNEGMKEKARGLNRSSVSPCMSEVTLSPHLILIGSLFLTPHLGRIPTLAVSDPWMSIVQ
jgi:hypothetical protein